MDGLNDTHPDIEKRLIAMLREVPVSRKLEMLDDLNQMVREIALQGLRRMYPDATEAQLRRRLADLLLGEELAERAYGPSTLKEPGTDG